MEMNRRSFVKGAVAAGMAGAVAAGATAAAAAEDAANAQMPVYVGHSWENPPAPIPADQISDVIDCEILIVGAGVAGLAAAEAAATRGADVVVVERKPTYTVKGADNAALGTKKQQEWGIVFDDAEKARIVREMHNWSQQTANIDLIKTYVYRSGEVFDHINEIAEEDGCNIVPGISVTSLKDGWDQLPSPYTVWRGAHSYNDWYSNGGFVGEGLPAQDCLGATLSKHAEDAGARFVYDTKAEQLLREDDGPVTGAVCSTEDGSYIQVNASKGVILATGDIGGNDEMLECWNPIVLRGDRAMPFLGTGDGLLMGMWVGAAHQRTAAASIMHPTGGGAPFMGPIMSCWTIVDIYGNRRGNEMPLEPYITDMRMSAPKNKLWYIFDSNYRAQMEKQEPGTAERIVGTFEENLDDYLASGKLVKADTLEELAALIDVPAENLVATIERRNGYCADGYDAEFEVPERFLSPVEQPPFYAGAVAAGNGTTFFGLHVDKNSQVLTNDDDPIEGLYAVGNTQGDFMAFNYPVMLPGLSHGRAITFGNLVGAALAEGKKISE